MTSALRYVELAEEVNGPIPRPVGFAYVWGDALAELERVAPDVRIINLETAVTKSDDCWHNKGINYRMHPENIPCITAAKIDCCVLANNHVLDWGYEGLAETLATLKKVQTKAAGAEHSVEEAEASSVLEVAGKGRVIVFSLGTKTSGIPQAWAASAERSGVNLLPNLSGRTVRHIADRVRAVKKTRDIVVASIHWGDNWGYQIPREQTWFAHQLIDEAGVDVVHGHSSHQAKGIEVYIDPLLRLRGFSERLRGYRRLRTVSGRPGAAVLREHGSRHWKDGSSEYDADANPALPAEPGLPPGCTVA